MIFMELSAITTNKLLLGDVLCWALSQILRTEKVYWSSAINLKFSWKDRIHSSSNK